MDDYDKGLEQELIEVAFGEVTETSKEIFAKLGREYHDGERLFSEGDETTELYIILSGEVAVSKRAEDGSQVPLACLGRGEILGEMSHFDDLPRSATATARGITRLLVLCRSDFAL